MNSAATELLAMDMAPRWTSALLAWPALLAQSLIFGSALLGLGLRMRDRGSTQASALLTRGLIRWWRALAIVVMVVSPLMFVGEVAEMAGVRWIGALPLLGEVLAQTWAGHTWMVRLPAVVALALGAWLPLGERLRAIALALLCALIMLCGSLKSHAIDFGALAVAMRFLHALAAATWVGALFGYWMGTRGAQLDEPAAAAAAAALSLLAAWSVVILVVSGGYVAYQALGHSLGNLIYSSYGRVLSFKLEGFAVLLAIGGYNRFVLLPTFDRTSARRVMMRNVGAEVLLITGVFGLAALLAATPPARMAMKMSRVDPPAVPAGMR
jgi:copper resistance protein D